MNSKYILELPLSREPSPHFKRFIETLSKDHTLDCTAQFWRGKLTFSSNAMLTEDGNSGSKASIVVDSHKTTYREVSIFTSKFNASMSVLSNNRECIEVSLCNENFITVTINVDDLASKMAIDNFFTVIDSSYPIDEKLIRLK